MEKECFKCHRTLDISEFYVHKQMKDGHLNKCKECTKKDVSERYFVAIDSRINYERIRSKRPERKKQVLDHMHRHRTANPEKYKAHLAVSNALRSKILIRPNCCSICGKICTPQGHHEDYSKPLDIIWVCVKCHRSITDKVITI